MTPHVTPRRAGPGEDWHAILTLIRTEFASMEGRIDPPSSMHRLTARAIEAQALTEEVWVIGPSGAPDAVVFLTRQDDALYLGKLAVAARAKGQGLARRLVALAERRARDQGRARVRLESRVELTEVHAVFEHLGFVETGQTSHPGYDRATSKTYEKAVT